MQWLTALLAFAVTMLIFAIIVSTFVEMIHRFWNLRAKGMQLMLERLYDKVVLPYLTVKPADPDAARTEFALRIMQNRASTGADDLPPAPLAPAASAGFIAALKRLPADVTGAMSNAFDFRLMTDVPVEVFTQKLADPKIVGAANNLGEAVLKDIAQKYVAFGDEIGNYFERRARLLSVFVALVVAWVFFVQPYKLVSTYVRSPDVAERVADLAENVSQQYKDQLAKLQAGVEEPDPDPAKAKQQIDAAVADFKEEMAKANEKVAELQGLGAAVGWPDAAKVMPCADKRDMAKLEANAARIKAGELTGGFCKDRFLWWTDVVFPGFGEAFWLMVGGLLVGLGAPFWAQAVSNLSGTRDLTRKVTEIVNPARSGAGGVATRGLAGSAGTAQSTEFAAFDLARNAAARDEGEREKEAEMRGLERKQRAAREMSLKAEQAAAQRAAADKKAADDAASKAGTPDK
jgi:hypothetical protein